MDLALYHPEHGYYRQLVRDYRTVPELHPLFGTLIGRQVAQMWELLGRPAPFRVVEMGAGRGHLARSVLEYFRRDAPPIDLRYTALDVGPRPAGLPDEVEWTDRPLESWPDGGLAGVLLSNELPDAFPVHRVVMQEGELREVYVEASPPSPPPLLPREERGAPPPPSPWKGEGRGEG